MLCTTMVVTMMLHTSCCGLHDATLVLLFHCSGHVTADGD